MNFGRQRSVDLGNKAGAVMAEGKEEVYGAFFGQSSMARMALVSEASVSLCLLLRLQQGSNLVSGSVSKFPRIRIWNPSPHWDVA